MKRKENIPIYYWLVLNAFENVFENVWTSSLKGHDVLKKFVESRKRISLY